MQKALSSDADAIRRQVLLALAENRAPGFHFPGHLLALAWPRLGDNELEEVMPDSPQARNVDGSVNLAAFCVHLDTALATASRLKIERGARQATVHLHAQFTGAPLRGELRAHARMHGYTSGAAVRESMTDGTIYAGDTPVCHASATFVVLPPPPGVTTPPEAVVPPSSERASDVENAASTTPLEPPQPTDHASAPKMHSMTKRQV